jgi:fatty acid amide hydrolase
VTTDIPACSATELARRLEHGTLRSVDIVEALLHRIDRCDPRINAYTHVFRDEALHEARRLDDERRSGRTRGPIHGLPVSVKECFDIAGQPTTIGVPARLGRPAARDAALVTALRAAGAVILGRTNVSQFMLFHESRNPVHGQTANPFDPTRTPGGSSGGEAAAIAAGMSPFGIGTDIGGSIRIPCHFTGICGLKTTLDRWPMRGAVAGLPGQEAIRSAPGPMARTTGDLELMFTALGLQPLSELDGRVPPLDVLRSRARVAVPSRVGCLRDDGILVPATAVSRALDESVGALEAAGIEVVPFRLPEGMSPIAEYIGLLSADGGASVSAAIGEDPLDPVVRSAARMAGLPAWGRRTMAAVLDIVGDATVASLLRSTGRKSVAEFWAGIRRIRAYREHFLDAMSEAGVDALLCPPHATYAFPHGHARNFAPAGSFSMLFNLLQMPAGVVPVTTVREDETMPGRVGGYLERAAARVAPGSAGLPIGVQVVGKPWQDERVLALMRIIEDGVGGRQGFPVTPVPLGL